MSTTLAVPDPITPEWLTAILRQAGVLQHGEVRTVEPATTDAFNSRTHRLFVHYSAEATVGSPIQLILKQNVQETWGIEAGRQEVMFYTLVASLGDHPPVPPPCYAAAYDPRSGQSYLLLQDLSATHQGPVTRDQLIGLVDAVPRAPDIDAVVVTLARLHSYWWDHPLRETDTFDIGFWSRNAERFALYLQRRKTSWHGLLTKETTWLPAGVRDLYDEVLEHLHRTYLERYIRAGDHVLVDVIQSGWFLRCSSARRAAIS